MRLNATDIPMARAFDICFCGDCPNAHVIFEDQHGRPLCHAVISARQAEDIARHIRARDPNFRNSGNRTGA